MKIYFVRHGESEYNIRNLINCDPKIKVSLTENGRKQVKKLANKFRKIRFDAIFTSPFPRAVETAEILNEKFKVQIIKDDRLCEIKVGFEGKDAKYYQDSIKKFNNKENFRTKNGESYIDVKNRVQEFLEDLRKTRHGRVLIVTHEMIVMAARAIFGELGDEDSLSTPIKNTQYFIFDL